MAKLGKQERIKRLQNHLATLKAGGSIRKRDMQSLLNDEQMQQYEDQWQSARDYKQSIVDGRSELDSYTEKLKIADVIWSRYENTKEVNQKKETEYAAESAYESALERLQELLHENAAIELLLDRQVSFEHGEEPSPSVGEVPRYRLSTSHYAIPSRFDTQRDIKIRVIEDSIEDLSQAKKQPHAAQKPADVAQTLAKFRKYRSAR